MTTKTAYPATLLCDFYKMSHKNQYPKGTEFVYSTWTARTSLLEGVEEVVAFGFQAFIKEYLIDYFNEHFFARTKEEVVEEYCRVLKFALGDANPDASHIAALHELGYLPIRIKAVEEGLIVPVKVPMLTIENTHPEFFWVTNYLETLMSCQLWMPTTSATIAFEYRKILEQYALLTTAIRRASLFRGMIFRCGAWARWKRQKAAALGICYRSQERIRFRRFCIWSNFMARIWKKSWSALRFQQRSTASCAPMAQMKWRRTAT